jgi:photosystem II stability/assembly factor-like uncharacterized protein
LPADRYSAVRRQLAQGRFLPADSSAPLSLGTWEPLGPGNLGGRTKALVIDPTTPGTMYAAAATGGIWKTTDAGLDWSPLTDSLPVLAMSSLAIDPANPQILYAGSGEQLPGEGIFRTTDGGQTWIQLAPTTSFAYVYSIAISPSRPTNVYAATDSGLWASPDGGFTWTNALPSPGGCYSTVVRGDRPADIVFAACSQTNGYPLVGLQVEIWSYPSGGNYAIYRGEMARREVVSRAPAKSAPASPWDWQMVLSAANMGPTALAIAPTAPNTIYALATSADTSSPFDMALLGLYASDQGGLRGTWELRADTSDPNSITANMLSYPAQEPDCSYSISGRHSGQGGWNLSLAVDPTNSQTLFAAGVRLSRSQDGGRTFAGITTTSNVLFHTDFHAYAFDPNYNGGSDQTLFNTNDGGVYRTDAALTESETLTCSQPFYSLSGGAVNGYLQVTQFYHGVVTPGGGLYLGGSQDTATFLGSPASTSNWAMVYGGDGGMSAFDPLDPNVMYFEYEGLGFARTTDGSDTYALSVTGITEPAADFPFVTYFALDPNHTQTLYIGGYQLWQSTDGAQTWKAAGPNTGASISAIAINPNNSNQVIYGDWTGTIYNGSISPAGNTWTSSQPRAGYVSGITFDTTQPGRIYATYATFRGQATDNQLYVSADNGNTWQVRPGSNLPDIPVHVLLIDPDRASTLYIGTDLGVFVSFDSGVTWARDSSLPAVVTESLQIDKNGATKYLYAFTYGRGAWRVNLTPGATECAYSVSPPTFTMAGTGGQLYSITVDTAPGCAWAASSAQSVPYVRIQSPAAGVGPGTLYFTVGTNFSGSARNLQINIQDRTVNIAQTTLAVAANAFDELASAPAIPSLPYYRAGAFNDLTSNPADPVHSCTGRMDLSTGWFVYTATASQQIDVSSVTGGAPGVLTAYPYENGKLGGEMGCATNLSNPAANVSLQFPVTAGARYAIEIAGVGVALASLGRVTVLMQVLPVVTIASGATSLSAGQATQFIATVTGTPNTAVRWTAQYGTIDANGNYRPPANLTPQTMTDTVTAISFADPDASASVTVTVQK